MIAPISSHIELLKLAPRAFGFGNEVGQRILPSVPGTQVVWTPAEIQAG